MQFYFSRITFVFVSFLGLSIGPYAFAEPEVIVGTHIVQVESNTDGKLWSASYPRLFTRILFGNGIPGAQGEFPLQIPKIIEFNKKPVEGVWILYGGTGAKSALYGIENSLGPVARSAIKKGIYPVAFENPLYFNEDKSLEVRKPIIDRFKNTMEQELWLAETIQMVVDRIPKRSDGMPSVPVTFLGRSTSSALIWDMEHRYLNGDDRFKVVESLSDVVLQGLLGHTDEEVAVWLPLEVSKGAKPEELDDAVQSIEADIFKGMEFAPHDISVPIRRDSRIKNLPKNRIILGAWDPRITPFDQFTLVERFSKYHPDLDITAFATDNDHNAVNAVSYMLADGRKISHPKKMYRLGPIMDLIKTDSSLYKPGLKIMMGEGYHEAGLFTHGSNHLATCDALFRMLKPYQIDKPLSPLF